MGLPWKGKQYPYPRPASPIQGFEPFNCQHLIQEKQGACCNSGLLFSGRTMTTNLPHEQSLCLVHLAKLPSELPCDMLRPVGYQRLPGLGFYLQGFTRSTIANPTIAVTGTCPLRKEKSIITTIFQRCLLLRLRLRALLTNGNILIVLSNARHAQMLEKYAQPANRRPWSCLDQAPSAEAWILIMRMIGCA